MAPPLATAPVANVEQLEQKAALLHSATNRLTLAHAQAAAGGRFGDLVKVDGDERQTDKRIVDAFTEFTSAYVDLQRLRQVVASEHATPDQSERVAAAIRKAELAAQRAETLRDRIVSGSSAQGTTLTDLAGQSTQRARNDGKGGWDAVDNKDVAACHVEEPGELCLVNDKERGEREKKASAMLTSTVQHWRDAVMSAKLDHRLAKSGWVEDLMVDLLLVAVSGGQGALASRVASGLGLDERISQLASRLAKKLGEAGTAAAKKGAAKAGDAVHKAVVKDLRSDGDGGQGEYLNSILARAGAWEAEAYSLLQYLDDHQLAVLTERLRTVNSAAHWTRTVAHLQRRFAEEVASIGAIGLTPLPNGPVAVSGLVRVRAANGASRLARCQWTSSGGQVHLGDPKFVDWVSADVEELALATHLAVHGEIETLDASAFRVERVYEWAASVE